MLCKCGWVRPCFSKNNEMRESFLVLTCYPFFMTFDGTARLCRGNFENKVFWNGTFHRVIELSGIHDRWRNEREVGQPFENLNFLRDHGTATKSFCSTCSALNSDKNIPLENMILFNFNNNMMERRTEQWTEPAATSPVLPLFVETKAKCGIPWYGGRSPEEHRTNAQRTKKKRTCDSSATRVGCRAATPWTRARRRSCAARGPWARWTPRTIGAANGGKWLGKTFHHFYLYKFLFGRKIRKSETKYAQLNLVHQK
jgi:hypothetical protein